MKIKKLIFSLFFLLLATENLFAKALPPGTGIGDVPANVLIMLDKSGSMGWRMGGGTAAMRYPYDADADSNGDIIVSQYNRDGVKKFVYASSSSDTGFGNNGVSGKGNSKYEGNSNCKTSYSYSGEVYNDVFYTTAYYERAVVAIRASDGRCLNKYNLGGNPYNMTMDGKKMYVGGSFGFKIIDVNSGSITNCNVSSNLRLSYGTSVDAGAIYSYRNNRIYRFPLNQSGGCPATSGGSFRYSEGNYVGLQSVGGNKMWTLSWSQSRMKKIQMLEII